MWKGKALSEKKQNLAGEFCVVAGEFIDFQSLMNTLERPPLSPSSHFSCSTRETFVSRVNAVLHVNTFINRLLCQIQRQIAKGYSVIWNCKPVDELCFCMEDIFNHGLKERLVDMSEITVRLY